MSQAGTTPEGAGAPLEASALSPWSPGAPEWLLPVIGLIVGVLATLPPYLTPKLDVAARAKLADHIIPGVLVILMSVSHLVVLGAPKGQLGGLLSGMAIFLTGFWMTATHVPLWAQIGTGQASLLVVSVHSAPGLALLALGLAWMVRYWRVSELSG